MTPGAVTPDPHPFPPNTLGFHRVMFAVDDVDDTVARLTALGGEVVREVVTYEDVYRLCYFRGPEGIVIGLAEELRREPLVPPGGASSPDAVRTPGRKRSPQED